MTSQPGPGYANLVRSIFKALQKLPAQGSGSEDAVPARRPQMAARPFVVNDERRVAEVVVSSTWDGAHLRPDTSKLDSEQREALASAWLADGLDEHAAIAAFARFTLQLMSLGAPPELLRGAHRASLDEVAHAELCFGLASVYAGRPLGAGPLDTRGALTEVSREAAVLDAIREGCVGETINAMVIQASADGCKDRVITSALLRIATDEMRHAGLAWRFVRWAIQDHPELRPVVREAFEPALRRAPASRPEHVESASEAWLGRYGRLTPRQRHRIAERCTASVIAPSVDALLDAGPRSFRHAARLMQG